MTVDSPEATAEGTPLAIGADLVWATEAAALASGRWMGSGEKDTIRTLGLRAMAVALDEMAVAGRVVVGEESDGPGPLHVGDVLGPSAGPAVEGAVATAVDFPARQLVDLAVDPVDGTSLVSRGLPNGLSLIAMAPGGALRRPRFVTYMEKMVVGPGARGALDIRGSVEDNLRRIAFARNARVTDLTVAMLDRPRHQALAGEVRRAGARIMMFSDGDVTAALMTALDWTGVDAMMGIGGAAEAVLAACALKCLGGELQCRFWPRSEEERRLAAEQGVGVDTVFTADDLVASDDVIFAASGVTAGVALAGVRYHDHWAETDSLVVSGRTGTLRRIRTRHQFTPGLHESSADS